MRSNYYQPFRCKGAGPDRSGCLHDLPGMDEMIMLRQDKISFEFDRDLTMDIHRPVVKSNRRSTFSNFTDLTKFTCNECGEHILIVTYVWSVLAGAQSERWQEWGPLKDNHYWNYKFKEKIEKNADDEVRRGNLGEFAEDDSDFRTGRVRNNRTGKRSR